MEDSVTCEECDGHYLNYFCLAAESLEGWKQAFLRPCHLDRQMYQLAIGPSKVAYGHEFHISILRVYGIASPEGAADVA